VLVGGPPPLPEFPQACKAADVGTNNAPVNEARNRVRRGIIGRRSIEATGPACGVLATRRQTPVWKPATGGRLGR